MKIIIVAVIVGVLFVVVGSCVRNHSNVCEVVGVDGIGGEYSITVRDVSGALRNWTIDRVPISDENGMIGLKIESGYVEYHHVSNISFTKHK